MDIFSLFIGLAAGSAGKKPEKHGISTRCLITVDGVSTLIHPKNITYKNRSHLLGEYQQNCLIIEDVDDQEYIFENFDKKRYDEFTKQILEVGYADLSITRDQKSKNDICAVEESNKKEEIKRILPWGIASGLFSAMFLITGLLYPEPDANSQLEILAYRLVHDFFPFCSCLMFTSTVFFIIALMIRIHEKKNKVRL